MKLQIVAKNYRAIFFKMACDYENEYLDRIGYPVELDRYRLYVNSKIYDAYVFVKNSKLVGFGVLSFKDGVNCIEDFYIIPKERNHGCGRDFAKKLLNLKMGSWVIKQLENAAWAQKFWVKLVGEYTHGQFHESLVKDPRWGIVTQQAFITLGVEVGSMGMAGLYFKASQVRLGVKERACLDSSSNSNNTPAGVQSV